MSKKTSYNLLRILEIKKEKIGTKYCNVYLKNMFVSVDSRRFRNFKDKTFNSVYSNHLYSLENNEEHRHAVCD